jgi:hypothetical protein
MHVQPIQKCSKAIVWFDSQLSPWSDVHAFHALSEACKLRDASTTNFVTSAQHCWHASSASIALVCEWKQVNQCMQGSEVRTIQATNASALSTHRGDMPRGHQIVTKYQQAAVANVKERSQCMLHLLHLHNPRNKFSWNACQTKNSPSRIQGCV